jgi:hypothetical protein
MKVFVHLCGRFHCERGRFMLVLESRVSACCKENIWAGGGGSNECILKTLQYLFLTYSFQVSMLLDTLETNVIFFCVSIRN